MEKEIKKLFFIIISALTFSIFFNTSYLEAAVVIDHTSVQDFDGIPSEYINQAKSSLRIGYQHTSHGSQIVTGMSMLSSEDSLYSYTYISSQSSSNNTDAFLSDYCMYVYGAYDLGNPDRITWADATRDYLNNNGSNRNIIMWSWCGQVSTASESDIADLYLANMAALEEEFPDVDFVYMTGHLDGTGETGNLKIRNQQIRDYVIANNKILFDFADIESYEPDGTYYPDESDACSWCSTWCEIHDCPDCISCAHSHCFNCYNKGKAFWYMMAILAGWDREESFPNVPVVIGTTPTNDTTPVWTWSSGGGGNGTFRYKLDDSDLSTGATETTATSYTPISVLSEGSHVLYVQESNEAGNWSDLGSFSIIVDITAPTAPIVTGSTPTNDTTPTWSWSPGGGGNGTYRYKLDDSDLSTDAVQTTATIYTPDSAFSDGSMHTLFVQERDVAGNWSDSGSKSISIDAASTPLSILTDTLQNGVIGQTYNVILEANVTDVTWTVSSGNLPDGVSLIDDTISGVPTMDGDYNFVITATDSSSGATADKSFTLTIEQNGSTEVSITDAIAGTTVIVSSNAGNISNLQAQDPEDLSAPSDYNFPYGVFKFQVADLAAGGSAIITLTFEDALSEDIVWYWYNSETDIWTDISDDINLAVNGSEVQITLTDGGVGDSDDVPGQITDPSGPALALTGDSNEDNSPDESSDVLYDGKDEDSGGCFISTAGE